MGAFPSPQRGEDGRRRGVLHLPMAGGTGRCQRAPSCSWTVCWLRGALPAPEVWPGWQLRTRPCWRLQHGREGASRLGKSRLFPGAGRRNTPSCATGRVRGCMVPCLGHCPLWECSARLPGGRFVRHRRGWGLWGLPSDVLACGTARAGWSCAQQRCPALVLPALPGLLGTAPTTHRCCVPLAGPRRDPSSQSQRGRGTPNGASSCLLWGCTWVPCARGQDVTGLWGTALHSREAGRNGGAHSP